MTSTPDGWRRMTLSGITKGGLFTDGDWVESKDQDPSGTVRLTQLADVGVGEFKNRSNRWLREDQATRLGCTFLEPNDVLIARMPDPIGRACLVPNGLGRAVTAVDVAVLRPASESIEPRYLMWAINAPSFHRAVVALQSGTTRKRISRRNLASLSVPVPPLEDQRRTVEILEDHLSRLDAGDQEVDNALRKAQTLAISALSRARQYLLQATTPQKSLGNLCDTSLGKMLDAKKATGIATPYLRNINVRWRKFDLTDIKSVQLTPAEVERLRLIQGDILVCEGGEPGRCAVWVDGPQQMAFQKALHRVRVKDRETVLPDYVALMIEESMKSGRARRLLTGTTIKHLPQEKLRLIEIPVPSIQEQKRLIHVVEQVSIAGERLVAEAQNQQVRAQHLRRSLLHCAFTGRLTGRLGDMDRVEEMARV